jgi:excisionase family DNA binding protein
MTTTTTDAPARPVARAIKLQDAAEQLGVSYETARRWATTGKLPAVKLNGEGQWRCWTDQLDEFVQAHKDRAATAWVKK